MNTTIEPENKTMLLALYWRRISLILTLGSLILLNNAFGTDKEPETLVINLADPTIFYHNGTYYLYGTGGDARSSEGFVVYMSKDLKNWSGPTGASEGYALRKGDAFGETGFWAPQVFRYNNKFYMAYTANEHIAIAVSDSPLGPFRQEAKKPLITDGRNIDPFVFFDADGKKYLYHVIVADGGNRIYVAELEKDLSSIRQETRAKCVEAEPGWENSEKAEWSVSEGPTVVKHGELYYLVYSANDFRSPDYAVGFAVSKSPLGPWKKYEGNPVLSKQTIGINGCGHGDLFQDKKGNWLYVFHTHYSENKVSPRKTALMKVEFVSGGLQKFIIDPASFRYLHSK